MAPDDKESWEEYAEAAGAYLSGLIRIAVWAWIRANPKPTKTHRYDYRA